MKRNKVGLGMLCFLLAGVFSGCAKKELSKTENSVEKGGSSSGEISIIKNENLNIDENKCIGCGKCARIASDNFEMNIENRKARVKSTEIANQNSIERAIAACYPKAISQ